MRRKFLMFFATTTLLALMASPALAQDPYAMKDQAWISISGTVTATEPDAFFLDYGDGTVIVEMDDWDWYHEGQKLLSGDRVTVYGEIDDDLFETTTIEASSVYVENLNSYFYASSADEEDSFYTVTLPIIPAQMTVRGMVTSVDPNEGEFTIATEKRLLTVETDALSYDPLDEKGWQKIEIGDRVSVRGEMDRDLFEGRELVADSVITLTENDARSTS